MKEPIEIPDEDRHLIEDIWHLIKDLMDSDRASEGSEIADIISRRRINLYPSDIKGPCYPVAVFLSLRSFKKYGRGQYQGFWKIMEKLVQHMQGSCWRNTTKALIYTDDWDGRIYKEWRTNIEHMRREGAKVYFVQVINDRYTILAA